MRGWFWIPLLVAGCGGKDTGDPTTGAATGTGTGTGAATGTGTGTGTGTATGSTSMPTDPRPLSIAFTGALSETIEFDSPTCSVYPNPANVNFRTFWRGTGHNAVLIAEVLSDFAGAGTYETGTHNLRVKLQTEAGTVYSFDPFQVDLAQGDAATLTLDHVGEVAYGSFDFTSMHGAAGALSAAPAAIPIWCEAVEN